MENKESRVIKYRKEKNNDIYVIRPYPVWINIKYTMNKNELIKNTNR